MITRTCRILALVAIATVFTPDLTWAQSLSDKGKKKLPKLFTDAVGKVSDSTVRIQSDSKDAALGTIVSANGYILTKGSEIRGDLSVTLRDGTAYDAELIGIHKNSDLALLKIDAEGLKPVTFTDPKNAEVGNWVAATGLTSEPIAVGVISVTARKLNPRSEEGLIQNLNKGYLGINLADPQEGEGVVVIRVEPKAAAEKAGMKAMDLIYELAGKPIKSRDAMIELLDNYKPDDTVTVKLKRGEMEMTLRVKLGRRSDFDRGAFQNGMGGALSGRRTGFPAVIQHDTVIRPTDCGGPLVDLEGRVIGINIARAGRVETWTLPSDVITPVLKELKEGKYAPIKK